ncbi:MAG: nucleotidyltransferase substrate binding protein [Candidatus Peregrinibacteria bacterium]|nr:nucleotidyltransferase substrate binding protein [Candidatus Peregrinibacteria bacterium]MDZ4245127.1 nucleotidyltransferase substrate binding protein [Candidatus Gracilibacteria bacterium]
MHEIITSFKKALNGLEEALGMKPTDIIRDASIQRFEFSVELAWKSTQKFLRTQNVECNSPKSCMKEAFKFGLIQDDPLWVQMMDDKNLTVHTYDEATAEKIYKRLPSYIPLLKKLLEAIQDGL